MKKNSQKFSLEEEKREDKRWNRAYKETKKGLLRTYLEELADKLKTRKIIILLCLAIATFLVIPVIPVLIAFLAGRWLRYNSEKR
ncbi:uncharacterized protein METZ01_LOCUS496244 [marine metagenome]|uniref:Uncharacterized protein n=1 Tax=marine metagenome TaxID=408172 RepID=A0A383DGF4_9ZZZZ